MVLDKETEDCLYRSMLFPFDFLGSESNLDKGYNVIKDGKVIETFDTMYEAEEFIDYKCSKWPAKYCQDDFNIKKG